MRIGAGWQVYGAVVAVGDISWDGKPDLVALDRNGRLWAYDGTGRGDFAPRRLDSTGWDAGASWSLF